MFSKDSLCRYFFQFTLITEYQRPLKSFKGTIRSFFKTIEVLFLFHSPKLIVDYRGIALYSGVSVMSLKI